MAPSISIIIVNWNSGALIAKTLDCICKQTVQPERIFVVDNASTDDSLMLVGQFLNVTLLKMPSNLGFAAANNRAFDVCNTEFVALLNPDAFPAPDWLEKLLLAAHLNPSVSSFGSRQMCADQKDRIDGIGDVYNIFGLVWRDRHGAKIEQKDLQPREIFSPCAAAALYRLQHIRDLGGFDEDFFCYVEDVDLGFRLRLAGRKSIYVPDAVVYHMGSAITGGESDFSIYHGHRNLVWTFVKNMPGMLFWLFLPLHILMNCIAIVYFIGRGRGAVILRAKRDAFLGLPGAIKKRELIQKRRNIGALRVLRVLINT